MCKEPKLGEQTLYQGQGRELMWLTAFLLYSLQMIVVYVRVHTNTDEELKKSGDMH
jgi:hypothetical protein